MPGTRTGATATDLSLTVHPHPTLSEGLGEAAEVLRGIPTHVSAPGGAGDQAAPGAGESRDDRPAEDADAEEEP